MSDPPLVRASRLQSWAILPRARVANRAADRELAGIYAESFRWLRSDRAATSCPVWLAATELGWDIESPADVTFTPLDEIEVAVSDGVDALPPRVTQGSDLWTRSGSQHIVRSSDWLQLYQYQTSDGWKAMFLPNGEGTLEWNLEFELSIPKRTSILVLPPDHKSELELIPGLLSSVHLRRMSEQGGMSVAVRPTGRAKIKRGDPIARIVLIGQESSRARIVDATNSDEVPIDGED